MMPRQLLSSFAPPRTGPARRSPRQRSSPRVRPASDNAALGVRGDRIDPVDPMDRGTYRFHKCLAVGGIGEADGQLARVVLGLRRGVDVFGSGFGFVHGVAAPDHVVLVDPLVNRVTTVNKVTSLSVVLMPASFLCRPERPSSPRTCLWPTCDGAWACRSPGSRGRPRTFALPAPQGAWSSGAR